MKGYGGRGPSQRQLRVGELVRHLLAEDLMRGEVHDRRLEGRSVTVSEVRVSPDLKHATVFTSELGQAISPDALDALQHAGSYLSGRLARRMHLKYAPRLHFVADQVFEEADRIERLIAQAAGAPPNVPATSHPGNGDDDEKA